MKKISVIIFILLCLLTTSCDNITGSDINNINMEDLSSFLEVTEVTLPTLNRPKSSDNIQEIDLNLPKNSSYLQYKKEFSYNNEYNLLDGRKIVEDKNLYLIDQSGNKTTLIEVPIDNTQMDVIFYEMIDDNRFSYFIVNHESTAGTGVYNLKTKEDYRIDICEDYSGYVPKKIVDNYQFFSKSRITDLKGFAKLNLDTYEFTEIDCSSLLNNNVYYWCGPDISSDGTKAAIYGIVSRSGDVNEYQVAVYSLEDEKILQTFNFYSENDYVNHQLLFYNDNQIYLFLNQYGDNPKEMLYIIDLN